MDAQRLNLDRIVEQNAYHDKEKIVLLMLILMKEGDYSRQVRPNKPRMISSLSGSSTFKNWRLKISLKSSRCDDVHLYFTNSIYDSSSKLTHNDTTL